MVYRLGIVVAALLLPLAHAAPASAQDKPRRDKPETQPAQQQQQQQQPPAQPNGDRLSVTEHEIKLADGKPLRYRATAGTLAMKDGGGKHKADVFFVAYEQLPAAKDPATRPVTFVFNGGPGAAAVWLHVGTAGPKRLKLNDDGSAPPPPHVLVPNEHTWLAATDLVFIDPVNTGYSRAAPGEDAKQFFGVENDVKWVSEFVRLYTTRYQRWTSPRFLAGESYGTTRAAALSSYLLNDAGIALNGIILVSSVLDFSTLSPSERNELPYALFLPSYTAVAGHHGKLGADLQKDVPRAIRQAERWALTEYVTALALGDALPDGKRKEIGARLAAFTGLTPELIEKANLRVPPNTFRALLLEDQRKVVGRFDGRLTGYDARPLDRQPAFDPSLDAFRGAYSGAFNDYVRRELRFESDLSYEVLAGIDDWDFGPSGSGPLYVADRLRGTMASTPGMKVFVAGGHHDLATPYFATRYTIDHMQLSPDLRANVSEHLYEGGHMMYHRLDSLKALNTDVVKFVREVAGTTSDVKPTGN